MRARLIRIALVAVLALWTAMPGPAFSQSPMQGTRETAFSPGDACEALLVKGIDQAREEVLGMAYGFTSKPVADALERAKARGVAITVVADCSNLTARGSVAPRLERAGIEVLYDCAHPIMHDKIWLFDRKAYTSGSYNPSRNAKKNAENLNLYTDPAGAREYLAHFLEHRAHALPREQSAGQDK